MLSNSGRHFTYYDLDVGYNVLPGEMFLGRGRAFNSALYVRRHGDVKFADKDQFAINFGVGTRILITDWLAHAPGRSRSRVRDGPVRTSTKNVNNIEATLGMTTFSEVFAESLGDTMHVHG